MNSRGEFNVFDLSTSQIWNDYLHRLPQEQQDIYYTPEYYRLYEELGDGFARCFIFRLGEDYAVYPFLLNPVNVLRDELDKEYFDIQGAYGYNGVVTTTYDNQFINSFYSAFDEFCKNENVIAEFTRFHPLMRNHLFSKKNLHVVFDRKTIYLDLQNSYDEIFANFQTTTRKQIKRATNRYDLEVKTFENDISILDDFYQIYVEAMVRVGSCPYLFFSKPYFKSLIKGTQNAFFIAYHEEKPIASISALYNIYYINGHLGGSLTNYLHMSPFSLLYSEMIKFGQKKGCKILNVGGGATRNPDDNLLKFKLNFSKTTSDFYIGKKIHNETIYNEIVSQWENRYPEKIEMYKNFLLKYRY